MAVRLSGAALDHDQRRRPAARIVARGTGRDDLAGGRAGRRIAGGTSALADRARAPRDLRGDAGGERAAARRRDGARAIFTLRATGPTRACPRPSKVPFGPATRQPSWRCGTDENDERHDRQAGKLQDRLDPALERHIRAATDAILAEQQPDGHWVYELEADATIPAEYVLMVHYFAEDRGPRARAQDRRLPAPHPGRAWRLAAVS